MACCRPCIGLFLTVRACAPEIRATPAVVGSFSLLLRVLWVKEVSTASAYHLVHHREVLAELLVAAYIYS